MKNIKQYKIIAFALFSFLTLGKTLAQNSNRYDLNIETGFVPIGDSDASFKSFDLRLKIATLALNDDNTSFLKFGFTFDTGEIDFKNNPEVFKRLRHFYRPGFSVNYTYKWSNKWSFIGSLRPRLSSNFSHGLKADDINVFGLAALNYSNSKNSRFTFGAMYANTFGASIPLPYLNYWKRINEKWDFQVGFPRTGISYTPNTKSKFTGFVEFEGFSGNISNNITSNTFIQNRTAERLNYRDTAAGLEYQYTFKNWMIKAKGGHTLKRKFELRNGNRDAAFEFNMKNSFFIGLGAGINF